jgi:hypothetical protein
MQESREYKLVTMQSLSTAARRFRSYPREPVTASASRVTKSKGPLPFLCKQYGSAKVGHFESILCHLSQPQLCDSPEIPRSLTNTYQGAYNMRNFLYCAKLSSELSRRVLRYPILPIPICICSYCLYSYRQLVQLHHRGPTGFHMFVGQSIHPCSLQILQHMVRNCLELPSNRVESYLPPCYPKQFAQCPTSLEIRWLDLDKYFVVDRGRGNRHPIEIF